jgi:hypothetical protein
LALGPFKLLVAVDEAAAIPWLPLSTTASDEDALPRTDEVTAETAALATLFTIWNAEEMIPYDEWVPCLALDDSARVLDEFALSNELLFDEWLRFDAPNLFEIMAASLSVSSKLEALWLSHDATWTTTASWVKKMRHIISEMLSRRLDSSAIDAGASRSPEGLKR